MSKKFLNSLTLPGLGRYSVPRVYTVNHNEPDDDGNVTIEVDPTLSIKDKPADAKAVGDAIGDISTALDSIIAMQEELIGESGGTKTITFTVEYDNNVYTANEGMDWYDWVESEYNTTGFYIDGHSVMHETGDALGVNGETIEPRDCVIADIVYQRL